MNASAVPVLEIGGTHVTAALVRWADGGPVVVDGNRTTLAPDGSADEIVDAVARGAAGLTAPPGAVWGVALPGPFDYATGIALYEGVGKFEALYGTDLRAALSARIPGVGGLRFVNDAEAFALGEWAYGAGRGQARTVAITLGTGIGSTFLRDGVAVRDGTTVPPEGRADLLTHHGRPLEETVSRRAVMAAYARRTGQDEDVREIAAAARAGEAAAAETLGSAFEQLGVALAPWLRRFAADVVVVGGSMVGSWDLIEPALHAGLGPDLAGLPLAAAKRPDDSPLFGAALAARRPSPAPATPGAAPGTADADLDPEDGPGSRAHVDGTAEASGQGSAPAASTPGVRGGGHDPAASDPAGRTHDG
ncbi:MAG TPA: ROK family protein [Actinocatenispora sp.]